MSWWTDLDPFLRAVIVVGGAVTALGVMWRPLVSTVETFRMLPILKEIADQFKPNAGTSLHDRVARIENQLQRTNDRLDDQDTNLVRILDILENR